MEREFVLHKTRALLQVFSLFGQFSYQPRLWRNSSFQFLFKLKIIQILPTLLFVCLTMISAVGSFIMAFYINNDSSNVNSHHSNNGHGHGLHSARKLNTPLMQCLLALAESSTNLIICIQSFYINRRIHQLFRQFESLEQILTQKLRTPITFDQFKRDYFVKISTCFFAFLCLRVVTHALETNEFGQQQQIMLSIVQLLSQVSSYHCVFHISLMDYFWAYINRTIATESDVTESSAVAKIDDYSVDNYLAQINYYKHVHVKLVDIANTINNVFGLRFISLNFRNFIVITNTVYKMFRFMTDNPSVAILRNYNFLWLFSDCNLQNLLVHRVFL